LCQKLEAEGHLVASFFFKREHASRGNAARLFATIAYQLAALPELNSIISRNLVNDPAVVNKSFSVQLEKLIIEPCRLANPASPPIVIIDGLDECEGRHVQEEILRSFANPILSPPPCLFAHCEQTGASYRRNLPRNFFGKAAPSRECRPVIRGCPQIFTR
jgi:hypothetical protein